MSTKDNVPESPKREMHKLRKGGAIFYEGDKGENAYLIQSGEVEIFTEKDGDRTILGVLGPGEIIGEMALFGEGTRTASVVALDDVNLIKINKTILENKLLKSDITIQAIVRMIAKRLSERNKASGSIISTISHLEKALHKTCADFASTLNKEDSAKFRKEIAPLLQEIEGRALKYKKK